MGKFVITKSINGEFRFRLNASNGETILVSEGYSTKANCENGIAAVRTNAQFEERFDKKVSDNNKFYFTLKATNGQIIGASQMYESLSGRDNGIAAVMTTTTDATVEDRTA